MSNNYSIININLHIDQLSIGQLLLDYGLPTSTHYIH